MTYSKLKLAVLTPLIFLACSVPQSQAADVDDAKAALIKALSEYTLGDPITKDITASIDAAAVALEQAAGDTPKLTEMTKILTGQWESVFSSQAAHPGSKTTAHIVLQELNPEKDFYRDMTVMSAGENKTPLLHIATADLGLAKDLPNVLEVRFHRVEFVPARADVNMKHLRSVLGLPEDARLSVDISDDSNRPVSRLTVTFVDEDLRINRGNDYIAVLRKIQ